MSWISESNSLGHLFHTNCEKFGSKTAFRRQNKKEIQEWTFSETHDIVHKVASKLDALGCTKGICIAICAESSTEWVFADWACQTLGVVLVPIYPTLPADQAQYIAQDCKAILVITQNEAQDAKFSGIRTLNLQDLIWKESSDAVLSVEDWRKKSDSVCKNDLATIIYTSGTTGLPKGAMLRHGGVLDLSDAIYQTYGIDQNDTFLSFLPLAHVFERYAGSFLAFCVGATVAHAGSIITLANDLKVFRPTIMCAVPRFFENLRMRILDSIEKQSPLKQNLFQLAFRQGLAKFEKRFAPLFWLTDKLIGKKIRESAGGNIRFFVSGGAALAPHVSDFYNAFGLMILQGYGLTETTAATSLNLPWDNRPSTVGPPIPGVEVKLASDGEILTRGSSIMKGYFNLPEETAEAFDSEGWFRTGDIGEFDGPNLKITDRKKDILVLANGKNVAPLKLESKLKDSDFINEAVVFGDGMEYCIALIVPEFDRIRSYANSQNLRTNDQDDLTQLPEIKSLIKNSIDKTNQGLADFERIKRHVILPAPFSVETGELTPSMKVKRKFVKEKFEVELNSMKR